jgi:hypothetical protein
MQFRQPKSSLPRKRRDSRTVRKKASAVPAGMSPRKSLEMIVSPRGEIMKNKEIDILSLKRSK